MADTLINQISRLTEHRYAQARYAVPLLVTTGLLAGTSIWLRLKRTPPSAIDTKPSGKPCRYRLDDSTSSTFTLPDGRKVGYAEYGSPTGKPVICLHGIPGSRIETVVYDEYGKEFGARLIGVDRPGIGWSSPHPNRTLLDHAQDVELLADHLGLHEYAILGTSGGGPDALACAYALPPNRLKAVSIVVGLGPPDIGMSGMNMWNWLGFTIGFKYLPALCRWEVSREIPAQLHLSDEERLEKFKTQSLGNIIHDQKDLEMYAQDPDLIEDIMKMHLRVTRETFAQGMHGWSDDGHLMTVDFGFKVEDIRKDLPVRLWYGKYDNNVPANHGVQIAKRLGGAGGNVKLRIEDETHLTLLLKYEKEIVRDLLEIM